MGYFDFGASMAKRLHVRLSDQPSKRLVLLAFIAVVLIAFSTSAHTHIGSTNAVPNLEKAGNGLDHGDLAREGLQHCHSDGAGIACQFPAASWMAIYALPTLFLYRTMIWSKK
jgi:hypothetical protein